jgi:hypothetical protein
VGARYLTDLADVCRAAGLGVIEVDDWQTRARGSGGYDTGQPGHVIVHHTASGPGSDGWPDVNYCCYGDTDAPIGNLYLARTGEVYVMAAGGSNTNGSGFDPCGIVPDDGMNSRSIAVEAGNAGTGEAWPPGQQDTYVRLVRALCDAYGIGVGQVHAHFEWAPDRKIDPAGSSAYAAGAAMWDMDAFRGDVALAAGPTPTPPPDDGDDMTEEQDRMLRLIYARLFGVTREPNPGEDPTMTRLLDRADGDFIVSQINAQH